MLMLELFGDAVDGLGKGKADGRGRDIQVPAQALAGPAGPPLPAVVHPAQELPGPAALVGHGGDELGVQVAAGALLGLDRAAGDAGPRHGGGGESRADHAGQQADLRHVIAAGRRHGQGGGVELAQHRRGRYVGGQGAIVVGHRLQQHQRLTGGVGGDGDADQIRLAQLLGGYGAVQRHAQILLHGLAQDPALQQLGIGRGHVGGSGDIRIVQGAGPGGDGKGGGAGILPGHEAREHDPRRHSAGSRCQQQHPQLPQQGPHQAVGLDMGPLKAPVFFIHGILSLFHHHRQIDGVALALGGDGIAHIVHPGDRCVHRIVHGYLGGSQGGPVRGHHAVDVSGGVKGRALGQINQIILQPDQLGLAGGNDHLQRQHHRFAQTAVHLGGDVVDAGLAVDNVLGGDADGLADVTVQHVGGGEPVQQGHGLAQGIHQGPGQRKAGGLVVRVADGAGDGGHVVGRVEHDIGHLGAAVGQSRGHALDEDLVRQVAVPVVGGHDALQKGILPGGDADVDGVAGAGDHRGRGIHGDAAIDAQAAEGQQHQDKQRNDHALHFADGSHSSSSLGEEIGRSAPTMGRSSKIRRGFPSSSSRGQSGEKSSASVLRSRSIWVVRTVGRWASLAAA